MGGFGSGRPRQRPSVEDGLTIDIGKLVRGGADGSRTTLIESVTWPSIRSGEETASIGFSAEFSWKTRVGELRLLYTFRWETGSDSAASAILVNSSDVPPVFRTVQSWNFPFMILLSGRGEFHEEIEVHGGADRVRVEAG